MFITRRRFLKRILGLVIALGIVAGSATNASAATFGVNQQLEVTNSGLASLDYLRVDSMGRGISNGDRGSVFLSLQTPLNTISTPIGPLMGTLLRVADALYDQSELSDLAL